MNIAKNIRTIRQEKGITQEVIADAIGFNASNYNRIENGKQELKANLLEEIAKALKVDVTYLLTYPKIYIDKETIQNKFDKILVTFEVSPDNKDQLLNLISKK